MHTDILQRLFNQQIVQTSLATAHQMVQWFGAVQAQEYAMAKWSLGLRMPDARDADIEKAFNDGEILRTHILRPTWHFVTPEDIRWMLELTAPRVHALNALHYKQLELDKKTLKRSKDLLIKHLQGGNFLDRVALQAIHERSKIRIEGLRLVLLLMHAELEGLICSGPRKGKQFTYALLAERAPRAKSLPREEALHKLAQRYFASRTPATVNDFAWWSGLTVKDAKQGAAMLPPQKVRSLTKQERVRATFLMPNFDEYGISYKNRDAVTLHGHNALYNRAIIVDGVVAGSWKHSLTNKTAEVETNFFVPLSKLQQQFANKAINRYKTFFA